MSTTSPESPAAFPEGFVWGAATAAHQVEGGNVNNHYWEWEHAPHSPFAEPSGTPSTTTTAGRRTSTCWPGSA